MRPGKAILRDARRSGFFWIDNCVYQRFPEMGSAAIVVYCCLAFHAGQKREAFPSYATIAQETGLSRRTAIRGVMRLRSLRLLRMRRRANRAGESIANLYRLTNGPGGHRGGGSAKFTPPSANLTLGGDKSAPRTTLTEQYSLNNSSSSAAAEPFKELLAISVREKQARSFASKYGPAVPVVIAWAKKCPNVENLPGFVCDVLKDLAGYGFLERTPGNWHPPENPAKGKSETDRERDLQAQEQRRQEPRSRPSVRMRG
jgi:hypothetical protein